VLEDDERLTEFRKQFYQSVLPDLPKIPGWHVCWLTTTNPADSIQRRTRLGYEPIKASEIPGWEYASIKTGTYEGCIGVNEMIAFKLPLELYEAFMYESHHAQPLAEEEKLSNAVDVMKQMMAASAKSRAQSAFGPRDDAFGLPALAIFTVVKTPLHLTPITCLGPTARCRCRA